MIENKNVPDPKQSWLAAEKILDRHFRNIRILRISLSVIVPAAIIGLALLFNNHKQQQAAIDLTHHEKGRIETNSSVPASDANYETENSISTSNTGKRFTIPSAQDKIRNTKASESTADFNKSYANFKLNSTSNNSHNKMEEINNNVTTDKKAPSGKNKPESPEKGNADKLRVKKSTASESYTNKSYAFNLSKSNPDFSKSGKRNTASKANSFATADGEKAKNSLAGSKSDDSFTNGVPSTVRTSGRFAEEASIGQLTFLTNLSDQLDVSSVQNGASELYWPKVVSKSSSKSHISWEASLYGGAQYVGKRLQAGSELTTYMSHRRNEEKAIVTPVLGFSISATRNLFSVSIGVEYATVGEKTNYYPYSLQDSIASSGSWQTFLTNYEDLDTAYITGNPYIIHNILQRADSTYLVTNDTFGVSKYDRNIAERNGINRISYIEIPVEVSLCLSQGRAGIGLSGCISPAWLVSQKGNYLKRNGRGIESFSEINTFRKFMLNARLSADFYYRFSGRAKLLIRPQIKSNLNSVFENAYGVKQKYYTTGVLFGVSYMLN